MMEKNIEESEQTNKKLLSILSKVCGPNSQSILNRLEIKENHISTLKNIFNMIAIVPEHSIIYNQKLIDLVYNICFSFELIYPSLAFEEKNDFQTKIDSVLFLSRTTLKILLQREDTFLKFHPNFGVSGTNKKRKFKKNPENEKSGKLEDKKNLEKIVLFFLLNSFKNFTQFAQNKEIVEITKHMLIQSFNNVICAENEKISKKVLKYIFMQLKNILSEFFSLKEKNENNEKYIHSLNTIYSIFYIVQIFLSSVSEKFEEIQNEWNQSHLFSMIEPIIRLVFHFKEENANIFENSSNQVKKTKNKKIRQNFIEISTLISSSFFHIQFFSLKIELLLKLELIKEKKEPTVLKENAFEKFFTPHKNKKSKNKNENDVDDDDNQTPFELVQKWDDNLFDKMETPKSPFQPKNDFLNNYPSLSFHSTLFNHHSFIFLLQNLKSLSLKFSFGFSDQFIYLNLFDCFEIFTENLFLFSKFSENFSSHITHFFDYFFSFFSFLYTKELQKGSKKTLKMIWRSIISLITKMLEKNENWVSISDFLRVELSNSINTENWSRIIFSLKLVRYISDFKLLNSNPKKLFNSVFSSSNLSNMVLLSEKCCTFFTRNDLFVHLENSEQVLKIQRLILKIFTHYVVKENSNVDVTFLIQSLVPLIHSQSILRLHSSFNINSFRFLSSEEKTEYLSLINRSNSPKSLKVMELCYRLLFTFVHYRPQQTIIFISPFISMVEMMLEWSFVLISTCSTLSPKSLNDSHTLVAELNSRLWSETAKNKLQINKYSPYLISMYLHTSSLHPIPRNVRSLMVLGVYEMIDICKDLELKMLGNTLKEEYKANFKMLYEEYKRNFKFKGKV